jgi:thiamine-phosphate pyrophosphorylase
MTDACRLYLLTPPALGPGFEQDLVAALDAGDVACLQVRVKDAGDAEVFALARGLKGVCAPRGVAVVVNDRPDLARTAGVDGVHIGQQDASVAEARAMLGEDAIVGVTCHNFRHLAVTAADQGADYVAFGAFFDTATKTAKARAEVDLIQWWADLMQVPCVAIGGITASNCAPLVRAGADFLAVSGAVWNHPGGPAAAVEELNAAIARASD